MVIVAESFYPAISSLNRETTSKALSCEELIPICKQTNIKHVRTPKDLNVQINLKQ
jgi:hypothetical protein